MDSDILVNSDSLNDCEETSESLPALMLTVSSLTKIAVVVSVATTTLSSARTFSADTPPTIAPAAIKPRNTLTADSC